MEACEFNTPEEVKKHLEGKKEKKSKPRIAKPKGGTRDIETGGSGSTPDAKTPHIQDDIFLE